MAVADVTGAPTGAATFDTPGGRTYALNMLRLGSGRLLPPEAHTSIGAWIDELLALVAAQAEQITELRGEHDRLRSTVARYGAALGHVAGTDPTPALCALCISPYVDCPAHGSA